MEGEISRQGVSRQLDDQKAEKRKERHLVVLVLHVRTGVPYARLGDGKVVMEITVVDRSALRCPRDDLKY